MVAGAGDDDAVWLRSMLEAERDLRPPRSPARESLWLGSERALLIRDEGGGAIAHAGVRRIGGAIEIITVVVDPVRRGEGLAHRLVSEAVTLAGAIGLDSGVDGGEGRRDGADGKVLCWTRAPGLATALLAAGFVRRRWLGPRLMVASALDGIWRVSKQLARLEIRRSLHQALHLFAYRAYVLDR